MCAFERFYSFMSVSQIPAEPSGVVSLRSDTQTRQAVSTLGRGGTQDASGGVCSGQREGWGGSGGVCAGQREGQGLQRAEEGSCVRQ